MVFSPLVCVLIVSVFTDKHRIAWSVFTVNPQNEKNFDRVLQAAWIAERTLHSDIDTRFFRVSPRVGIVKRSKNAPSRGRQKR